MGYTILVFLFIVGGTYVLYMAFGKSAGAGDVQRVKDRLLGKKKPEKQSGAASDSPSLIKSDELTTSVAQKVLNNLRLADRVEAMLEQAGMRWTPAKLMQTALGFALAGYCVAWFMLPPPFDNFAWVFGLVGFGGPFLWIMRKGKARLKKFEEQFPDSLEFV